MTLFFIFMGICIFFLSLTFIFLLYSKKDKSTNYNPIKVESDPQNWRDTQRKQRDHYVKMVNTPKPKKEE